MSTNDSSSSDSPIPSRNFPPSIPRAKAQANDSLNYETKKETPEVSDSEIICPICKKDDKIRKVSSIVIGETSSGIYTGPSGGVTYSDGKFGTMGGYSTLHGTSQTSLAQMLTPPNEPQVFTGYIGWEMALLFIIGIVGCCGLAMTTLGEDGVGYGVGGLAVTLIIFMFISANRDKRIKGETEIKNVEKTRWNLAMEKWFRLYYCERDDLVFDPRTRKACHPVEITAFVYDNDGLVKTKKEAEEDFHYSRQSYKVTKKQIENGKDICAAEIIAKAIVKESDWHESKRGKFALHIYTRAGDKIKFAFSDDSNELAEFANAINRMARFYKNQ